MRFVWDDAKNKINLRKHGIDFADTPTIFDSPMLAQLDNRDDYGEERWIGIGWIRSLVCVVVYVEISDEKIRIISARKATKNEVRLYEQRIKN